MEIINNYSKKSIRKIVDPSGDTSLMLGKEGSYLWLQDAPASRYQGWFFRLGSNLLLKIVDDINVLGGGGIVAIENNFDNVKRIRQNVSERFFLFGNNCLGYESNKPVPLEIFLDVKEPYQNPEFGRHYRVWQENGMIFVDYYQETQFLLSQVFIAISGDFGAAEIKNEWVRHDYDLDRRRGSSPWERWVFKPAALQGSKLLFAVGTTKEEAQNGVQVFSRNYEKIKLGGREMKNKPGVFNSKGGFLGPLLGKKNGSDNKVMAKLCVQNALPMLYSRHGQAVGLRAGLPWFFQFWQRDEAVSLKGLAEFDQKAALDIFWRQMGELKDSGYHFKTADGAGWLFLRAADFIEKGKLNIKETAIVLEYLEKTIDYLLKNRVKNGLAVNTDEKTWMDSLDRSGAPIEIQALRLNMYSLAGDLAADKKQKDRYTELESGLARAARQLFFDGNLLADRFDVDQNYADTTIRPNIFLAAYVFPRLLSRPEWETCFAAALDRLWLDWGGLSTIDKNDSRFRGRDTGQDPAAYHNGDSWFYVNNLAAIALARANRKKFKDYIDKIFEASANDILWHGAIGCASEISSAQIYEPAGCPNQAWSNATFLELCEELDK